MQRPWGRTIPDLLGEASVAGAACSRRFEGGGEGEEVTRFWGQTIQGLMGHGDHFGIYLASQMPPAFLDKAPGLGPNTAQHRPVTQ